jgi:hypothetical protein
LSTSKSTKIKGTLQPQVVDKIVIKIFFFHQPHRLPLQLPHLPLQRRHFLLRPLPNLPLQPFMNRTLKFLQILLQIQHHILHNLIQHLQKLATQQHPHLTLTLQDPLRLPQPLRKVSDEIGRVGQGCS